MLSCRPPGTRYPSASIAWRLRRRERRKHSPTCSTSLLRLTRRRRTWRGNGTPGPTPCRALTSGSHSKCFPLSFKNLNTKIPSKALKKSLSWYLHIWEIRKFSASYPAVGSLAPTSTSFSLKLNKTLQGGGRRGGQRPQQYHGWRRYQDESRSERGNRRGCQTVRGGGNLKWSYFICVSLFPSSQKTGLTKACDRVYV